MYTPGLAERYIRPSLISLEGKDQFQSVDSFYGSRYILSPQEIVDSFPNITKIQNIVKLSIIHVFWL